MIYTKKYLVITFICLLTIFLGCAENIKNLEATSESRLHQLNEPASLTLGSEIPKFCKPMGKYKKGVQIVKEGFITLPYLNSVISFTDMHVRSLANLAYLFATVETQCN
ncbi:MAG: hypothetical protein ACPL7B_01280 [Candidatus Poribacteria bacterium]